MGYLVLSIVCSSLIFVIFKLYSRYQVQTSYAIIINYMTASSVGFLYNNEPFGFVGLLTKNWFIPTLFLGLLFILIFNLIAKTSQVLGVSVASVATKMSLTIPVLFGVFLYKEDLGLFKIIGVLLALAAVYFVSVKGNSRVFSIKDLYLPSMVFLGSGLIDAAIQYGEQVMVPENEFPLFSATVFGCAACWGVGFVSVKLVRTPIRIRPRTLIGGIALGVPNYFTVYFLLRALQNEVLNSASVFTINNVAVVMISTLVGIVLFKEVISPKNWIGIILAVLSIILVIVF